MLPQGTISISTWFEADQPSGTRLALICSTCDEPFVAEFLRRCQWCGHDFGDGLPVDVVAPAAEDYESLNGRVLAVALALVGLVVVAVIYVAVITGQ